jgi:hypothetical protein
MSIFFSDLTKSSQINSSDAYLSCIFANFLTVLFTSCTLTNNYSFLNGLKLTLISSESNGQLKDN